MVLFLPKDSIKLTYHVEEKEKKRKERKERYSPPLVFLVANDRSRERERRRRQHVDIILFDKVSKIYNTHRPNPQF